MKKEESSIARQALSWLLCAQRKLPSIELLAAVSPNPDEPVNAGELLHLCRHLIVQNEVTDSFELAHLSVREYLETRKEYQDGQPHAPVAELCIKLVEGGVEQGGLHRYASLYWADHYHSRPQMGEDPVTDMVKKIFRNEGDNPAFRKWVGLARKSSNALPWHDDVRKRIQDAGNIPLAVVSVFGFPMVLDQWKDTTPSFSYFRDSADMVVHLAIKWGNKEVVRWLLRNDAQPAVDRFGWTASVWATVYKQRPILEVLKELYGNVDAKDEEGWTALHWMVFLGRTEGLEVLLSVGAGPNIADTAKWTPLHWAAVLDRNIEVEKLVKGGHGLDAKDGDGLTPSQWAKFVGHEATANHLRDDFSANLRARASRELVRIDWEFMSSNPVLICLEMQKVRPAKQLDLGLLTDTWSLLHPEGADASFAASWRDSDCLMTLLHS